VTGHTDSRDALDAVQEKPDAFDLVITNQSMPQLTGEDLARELLRLRPDLPMLLCTGFSPTLTEEMATARAIRVFLMKPIGRGDLCLAPQRLLAERAARSV
jgi:two-component system cell cycle sensor histidine kinase/response regulator CckA